MAGAEAAAVDATCCRVMGIDPGKVGYLKLASERVRIDQEDVVQTGEPVASVANAFGLVPELRHLRF